MKVAVLTLTRDRLEYTKHCFASLERFAGCDYDHYVLDQGSTDGTLEWLLDRQRAGGLDRRFVNPSPHNVGISRGLNMLLVDVLARPYDVIVKFDNDCELLMLDTLRDVCEATLESGWLLSPRIQGLRNPVPDGEARMVGGDLVVETVMIGGIFLAAPARIFQDGYRHNEANPLWEGDDRDLCGWYRARGGHCGYVKRLAANHFLTTDGQWQDDPGYFERKQVEGMPA